MANFKANRTEEDILREMTAILRELKDPRIDPMLTVVRAELSRDLSDCKIFVSSLSGKDAAKEYFRQNPAAAEELEKNVRENFHKLMGNQSKIAARAAGRAVDVSADDFDDSDE